VGRRLTDGVAPALASTAEVSASRAKEEPLLLPYSVSYSFHPLGMPDHCTKRGVPDAFPVQHCSARLRYAKFTVPYDLQ
jgi:hypothetical protein